MPELRKDPIIGRWVIISTERGQRPSDWSGEKNDKSGGFCPFCPGNEDKTPPEIFSFRQKKVPNQIRLVGICGLFRISSQLSKSKANSKDAEKVFMT